ncbi:MAG: acyl-CoA dehydrogenase [Rhodospirillales bacterium 70-18]|nr:acyl-CoA dehydrogenase family protein [Rhodospirillales bacterium]OJY73682.1 MAG: acyl-CoA dehydrogenase [Rhodospirillales bacterium 70-18]
MDFDDTQAEAAFRAEVRAFLAANARPKAGTRPTSRAQHVDAAFIARAKDWQARKAAAGLAAITWPKAWGGREMPPMFQVIYNQEEEAYATPRGVFEIGLGMCIPTMMAYATPAQLERHVAPALRGEEIWCQLFSEPAGGSDVAGLRTRAERDGEDWVINGQKIWTSGAHFADFGIIVTRSDPNVPKHAGLTFFFLDMTSPGVEARPIRQISGASHFNEVFFTDVRIPDSQRLGAVGQGWKVSLTTLMNERLAVGEMPRPDVDDLLALCRLAELDGAPALANAAVRERIAEWHVRSQGLKFSRFRTMTALSRGQTPGPESSIAKLVNAAKLQDIASFGLDLLGPAGVVMDPALAPLHALFQEALLFSPGLRIAGGTDEILRNIIAERVLGLPGDIRVDKDKPFNQLPQGTR